MTDADEQLTSLRKAALGFGEWMEAHPALADPGSAAGVALAMADHLAACTAAVDAMCCAGDLPSEWAQSFRQWAVAESRLGPGRGRRHPRSSLLH